MAKLDDNHTVIRNVPWAKLRRNENDDVIGVLGEAFRMRPGEDTLSSTWLEFFAGSREEQIVSSIQAMRASALAIKTKSGFAVGNVGQIKTAASSRGHGIRIVHEPEPDNSAHAAVRRMPREDSELLELLAVEAWAELILNKDIP